MTKPNLFIIESLEFDEEQKRKFEGKFLSQILYLGGKKSAYYYFRTEKELQNLLKLFDRSDYRYLHLSCHGVKEHKSDPKAYAINTTLDLIPFNILACAVNPYLSQKRLFISACSVVNEDLAKEIIPSSGCISIIGPAKDPNFNDAAITWASFYHLMFKEDSGKMVREDISTTLCKVATTFGIPLNYFSISKEYGFKGDKITTRGKIIRIYPPLEKKK